MNKADLISEVYNNGQWASKAAAERAVEAVLGSIRHGLKKDGGVTLVGFGTFTVKKRGPRKGRNPQTGEPINIGPSRTVTFRCGKALKESV